MRNMKGFLLGGMVFLSAIAGVMYYQYEVKETWPNRELTLKQVSLAEKRNAEYRASKIDASTRTNNYTTKGDYLNYGATKKIWVSSRVKLDDEGIPMVKYGEDYQYNPVTISQYALSEHGRAVSDGSKSYDVSSVKFKLAVKKLLLLQDGDGAFRYHFPYRHYTNAVPYADGWVSGMAQGVALSAIARDYIMSKDEALIEAGDKAVSFLRVPATEGGPFTTLSDLDPSLSEYIFFQEYLTSPNVYTLNGFMFALLGLYDWNVATKSEDAKYLFLRGVDTLVKILPYYDMEHMSSYDLSYITHKRPAYLVQQEPHIAPRYHAVHISLLQAIYSVTGNAVVKEYKDRWSKYVGE